MKKKNKLKNYRELIGKTIAKIEDDDFSVRLHFKDGTFATVGGDYDYRISLDESNLCADKLTDPEIYK